MGEQYVSYDQVWENFWNPEYGHRDLECFIRELQEKFPCTTNWFKRETWTLQEAILIYHKIDPFILDGEGIPLKHREQVIGLIDAAMDVLGNLSNYLKITKGAASEISIGEFIDFLIKKSYPIPEHFPEWLKMRGKESLEIPVPDYPVGVKQDNLALQKNPVLKTIADVYRINYDGLSSSVLASLGVSIIGQAVQRKFKAQGKIAKISDVLQNKFLESFINDCGSAEGKDPRGKDTIREYLEPQFKKI